MEVINEGQAYTTYIDWVVKNVSDKDLTAMYRYGSGVRKHTVGVVKAIAPHDNNGKTLYYIEMTDGCVLVGEDGVRPRFKTDSF